MSSQNNKKVVKVVNPSVNTNLKHPIPIRPKPTVLEQNSSVSSIITTELASTSKEIAIDLTMVCTYVFVQN